MKTLIAVAILILFASIGEAASYYGNDGYSRRVRRSCEDATSTRDRKATYINKAAAQACFVDVLEIHRQQRLINSRINLNEALTEYLHDADRFRRGHGRVRR